MDHEALTASGSVVVNDTGDQLLTRASLAGQQYTDGRMQYVTDRLMQRAHWWAHTDQAVVAGVA